MNELIMHNFPKWSVFKNVCEKRLTLTLPVPIPIEEKKLTSIFIFTHFCGAVEGFLKTFKAFIKPFTVPQRSVKIKI